MRRATKALANELIWTKISIHALLAESDRGYSSRWRLRSNFYPRSPCGERPIDLRKFPPFRKYFYPRSPCGERPYPSFPQPCSRIFLSTLSLRRATFSRYVDFLSVFLISIHALLAESDRNLVEVKVRCQNISIHALLAESDYAKLSTPVLRRDFYPRSPCGERRTTPPPRRSRSLLFLSTLSLRRATPTPQPRPPRRKFLSTLSLRRATAAAAQLCHVMWISIHALLAESDRSYSARGCP